jgi:hypothetical protein
MDTVCVDGAGALETCGDGAALLSYVQQRYCCQALHAQLGPYVVLARRQR